MSVLCIDEPERGLSSKQAFKLGRFISKESQLRFEANSKSVLIAVTHSPELMKGMLTENDQVTILRKYSYPAPPRILSPSDVQHVWKDPYLSYSRALDGVFHDIVVFCESDGDCLLYEKALGKSAQHSVKDILFCPTAGKSSIAKGLRGLRRINPKSVAIVDIDIFKIPKEVKELLEACGACEDCALSISNETNEWKEKVEKRGRDYWKELKRRGEAALENDGEYKNLKEVLSFWGIFICPAGELEGFDKQPEPFVIPQELCRSDLEVLETQLEWTGKWTELHVYLRLKSVATSTTGGSSSSSSSSDQQQENRAGPVLKQLKSLGEKYVGEQSYMDKAQHILKHRARMTSKHGPQWVIEAIQNDRVDWDRVIPFVENVTKQADDCRWQSVE
jgi:hypothetical protein